MSMKESLLNKICAEYTLPDEVKAMGIYPYYRPIESGQDPVVKMQGRDVMMFGSNSYLGLSDDPRLKEAAIEAIRKYGTSCSGSRFLNGTLDIHLALEEKLAKLVGKEEAVTYSTGFQVNLGVVSCLGFRNGYIFLDALDHACIIDGSRLSYSRVLKFPHNDVESLEKRLALAPIDAPKLIVVDGVYSMEGDIAPIPEMVALCEKYNASLMIDDAHGLGVLGDHGRGTANHFGLTDKVDLIMGTFSKSFGSLGGFIAGDHEVLNFLKHNSRSLIFSASMPPANVAAVSRAIDIMLSEPERLEHLWALTRHAHEEFKARGFDIGHTQSPIIPLFVRDLNKCLTAVKMALEEGVFITPVIPPAVPEDSVIIRFALMATHSFEQLDEAIEKLTKVFKKLEIIP
jgi:8-amino-7-oxononanoate synthase